MSVTAGVFAIVTLVALANHWWPIVAMSACFAGLDGLYAHQAHIDECAAIERADDERSGFELSPPHP